MKQAGTWAYLRYVYPLPKDQKGKNIYPQVLT